VPGAAVGPGVAEAVAVGRACAEPLAAGDPPAALVHLGVASRGGRDPVNNTVINAIRPSAAAATEPVMNIRRLVTRRDYWPRRPACPLLQDPRGGIC
jgi:hypothetical protein